MAKLKLNLPTGAVVEKPIVTCFEIDNKKYLILDAENIGSMGLPIILVCKIENDRVLKITDAAEWQQAKDYLKGIIAGNSMNYVAVSSELAADEVYYTQLTLPVASFDVIKNSYNVEETVVEQTVVEQTIAPEVPVAPVVEPVVTSEVSTNPVNPVDSVVPVVETTPVVPETSSVEAAPVIDIAMPEVPVASEATVPTTNENVPVIDIEPVVSVVEPVQENAPSNIDYNEVKETFLKACENMFDALVSKFQEELNSKK